MKNNSTKHFLLLALAVASGFGLRSQSLPALHDLSGGNYSLTEWADNATAGTYPSNAVFHYVGAEQTTASTSNSIASFDFNCAYNLTSRPRFLGKNTNGIGLINTGSSQFNDCVGGTATNRFVGILVVGLNATGLSNITVNWTGRTLNANSSTRNYRIILQYRVGNTGDWTLVDAGTEYIFDPVGLINNTTGASQNLSQILPADANNESEVYVRWLYYSSSGSGNRPELGIDDITVQGFAAACTIPDAVSSFNAAAGDAEASLSWVNGTCYDEILIVARQGSAVSFSPSGDGSPYTANGSFGLGTEVSAGQFVVYKGVGSGFTSTGLTNGQTYHYAAYARKGTNWTPGQTASASPSDIAYFWNGGDISANPANGGSGTWTDANTWRSPSATGAQATWVNNNKARFDGTAGDILLTGNIIAEDAIFSTSDYAITTIGGTARNLTGPIEIANGGNLNMAPNSGAAGNGTIGITSVSGAGSTLTLNNTITDGNTSRVNLIGPGSNINVPVIIDGNGTGLAGIVSTSVGAGVNESITNSSSNSRTLIGATAGFDLNINAAITGNNGLQISAGASGGAGIINLNAQSTYSGSTIINNSTTGVVRLGINDAFPTTSVLEFGIGTNNHGSIDLAGYMQNSAGLSSTGTGNTNGIVNTAAGNGVININNSDNLIYNGRIGQPGNATNVPTWNNNISLQKNGSGTQVLNGILTYEGSTIAEEGRLIYNSVNTATNAIAQSFGTFAGSGAVGNLNVGIFGNINPGGTISGESTANLAAANTEFFSDSQLTIDINNATGAAGSAAGWDLLTVSNLQISSIPGSPLTVKLVGLDGANLPGPVANFNNAAVYSWTIVTSTGISGFDPTIVVLDASDFVNNNPLGGGSLSLVVDGNDLKINFTPPVTTIGCTDPAADNYDPAAVTDDGSCIYSGCTDNAALNFNPIANNDDGSCYFTTPKIVINELHYNPADALGFTDAEYEFLELYNNDNQSYNISGWSFSQGIVSVFPAGTTIAPGEYIVVALTPVTYTGNGYQVFGFTGNLNNAGETVTLVDAFSNVISTVTYSDIAPWPTSPDGNGPSLELINPDFDLNNASSWCGNGPVNGTPGTINSCFSDPTGCTNPSAINYDPGALIDDGSCIIPGCTYSVADNFNPAATIDNGTCVFSLNPTCPGDFNDDGIVNFSDLSFFLSIYGSVCP